MATKRKNDYPRTISYGSGKVRISKRANGMFSLAWREMGEPRKTTKATEAKALEFAEQKAHDLDAGEVRRWVNQGEAEALEALRELAKSAGGTEESSGALAAAGSLRRLVEDVRGALGWLAGGKGDLTAAARWYAENGPLMVERTTLAEAIKRFLAEYQTGSPHTYRTFSLELTSFLEVKAHQGMMLMDLNEPTLTQWTTRRVNGGADAAAARTVDNRMTTWITFLNRCRDWNLLLANGKHAGDLLRRPVVPAAGREIFTVAQGAALLAAVRKHDAETQRAGKQLEVYLLIGGWLGLRPSEIQRLTWEAFDWHHEGHGYCHVSPKVAQKNASERYVPMDARLSRCLWNLFVASGKPVTAKCCGFRSREFLSVLAREQGVCQEWPNDGLRHSFCSYRIAVVRSLEQVATEADNSPAILKSNYRRPLRHEDGLAWWDLLGEADA